MDKINHLAIQEFLENAGDHVIENVDQRIEQLYEKLPEEWKGYLHALSLRSANVQARHEAPEPIFIAEVKRLRDELGLTEGQLAALLSCAHRRRFELNYNREDPLDNGHHYHDRDLPNQEASEIMARLRSQGFERVEYKGIDSAALPVIEVLVDYPPEEGIELEPIRVECHGDPEQAMLLIMSGLHGDEAHPIVPLQDTFHKLGQQGHEIAPYIVMPCLFPEAFNAGTRRFDFNDGKGPIDGNRIFSGSSHESLHPKAKQILRALQLAPNIEFAFAHHADNWSYAWATLPDEEGAGGSFVQNGTYIYDQHTKKKALDGEEMALIAECKGRLSQALEAAGIPTLTGWDDPSDPNLGVEFKDGHADVVVEEQDRQGKKDPSLDRYLAEKIAGHALCVETPGWLSKEKRQLINELLVIHLELPLVRYRLERRAAKAAIAQ